MIAIWRDERLAEMGCTLRLQVHDELILNCPEEHVEEAAALVQSYMENPFPDDPLQVPLPAVPVIVDNWEEGK